MTNEIRELGPDDQITEPGFYRVSLQRHHSQLCDGPSVTSSVLRTMELGTPSDVWSFHQLNKNRMWKEKTDALRIGSAMHAIVDGGMEELERQFATLPSDAPKRPTQPQINAHEKGRASEAALESIKFWNLVDRDPRDYITKAEWELLTQMGGVLAQDPAATAALGGIPEITMAWKDRRNGIWCLARPDNLNFSGLVSDYKTTAPKGFMTEHFIDRQITDYGLDMQLGFAATGYEELADDWPTMAGLVFQMKKPPFHVMLRSIDEEDLRIGAWRAAHAVYRFGECLDSGNWPGPGAVVGSYKRPEWQRERLLEQMQKEGIYL